jgi:multidrug resistance protein, MATE family
LSAVETAAAPPRTDTGALLRLAGPIVVSQLAVMGLAVIDTVMAGRLSANDLAAVAIGASIYGMVYVTGMGLIQALTPIAGHHFGAGRHREVGIDLGQMLWLCAVLALLGGPLLWFNGPFLDATGAAPAVHSIAAGYLHAAALALPAALCTRAYFAVNSAVSRPQVTMALHLVALAAKVPLNLAFMYGIGPLPALGGAGCGWATALISWLLLAASVALWRLDPHFRRFHSPTRHAPRWARQRELLRLGLPSAGSLMIEVSSFTLIALAVVRLGAETVGGHQIVANIVSVMYMVPLALGVATGVLVAQCLCAGAPRLARQVALRGFRITVGVAAVLALLLMLVRGPLVAAYTTDAKVAQVALSIVALAAAFHVFDAAQGLAGFVLRAYKVAFLPMLIHAACLWGVGLVGGYVLAFHTPFGQQIGGAPSFWLAQAIGLMITAAALGALSLRVARAHLGRP